MPSYDDDDFIQQECENHHHHMRYGGLGESPQGARLHPLQGIGWNPPQAAGGGQPLKANKADGFADTAQKRQAFKPTALPSCRGGTHRQASPLEGQGGFADLGGSQTQPRGRAALPPPGAGRLAELRSAKTTLKRPPGRTAPERGED